MTIDQVIELGKIDYNTTIFAWRYWIWWFIIAILLLVEVVVWTNTRNYDFDYDDFNDRFKALGCSIVVFLILICANFISDENKKQELIEEWKTNVAMPFILNQVPEYKKEVIYLKIDPELSHDVRGTLSYTYSNEVHRTPLTISFKTRNGISTLTNWFETHMELTNEEQPFIAYKYLDTNLGHDVNKGLYDVKVYLPDTYKFTDIK